MIPRSEVVIRKESKELKGHEQALLTLQPWYRKPPI